MNIRRPRWTRSFRSTLGRRLVQIKQRALQPSEETGFLFGEPPPGSSFGLGLSQVRAFPHI